MKKLIIRLLSVAVALGVVSTANAARVIAVNFASGNGKVAAGTDSDIPNLPLDGAGWNNQTGANGSDIVVKAFDTETNSSLSDMTASLTYSSPNTWSWDGATTGFIKGYLDDGGSQAHVTLTGIPFEYYDVIIATATDTANFSFRSVLVNSIAYYADENGVGVRGSGSWGQSRKTTPTWGKNLIRVKSQKGASLQIDGQNNAGSARGCIAAVIILEVEPTIVTATVSKISEANALEGDIFNLQFADGATLTADVEPTREYNLVSTGMINLVMSEGVSVSGDLLAKLNATQAEGGVKITFTDVPAGLVRPPVGYIFRFEGETPLAALPLSTLQESGQSGVIEVARPIVSDGAISAQNDKNYVFANGFSMSALKLILGNKTANGDPRVAQNVVQQAGDITLTAEYNQMSATTGDMPLLMSHWPSDMTYALEGGSISCPNGAFMFGRDGTLAMTVGGKGTEAALAAYGISQNGRSNQSSLTIKTQGTVTLGAGGIEFTDNKTVDLAGGTLKFTATAPLTVTPGISVSADSTIEVADGATVTLTAPLSGSAKIVKTGRGALVLAQKSDFAGTIDVREGSLDLGGNRCQTIFASGTTMTARESITDDGVIRISGLAEDVPATFLRVDGTEIADAKVTREEDVVQATFTPEVVGKVALLDLPFDGSLVSVGTDTRTFSYDQGPYYNADNTAVLAYTRPWNGIQLTAPFTAAVYGTVPSKQSTCLISFGSSANNIFLASGAKENEVVLISVVNGVATELTKMTVPNAASIKHLYAFALSADQRTVDIYLDGVLNIQYVAPSALSFGAGLQVSGWFGGTVTGYGRCDNESDGGEIDQVLVYNAPLKANAMSRLSTLFPYASASGLYQRTLTADGSWTSAGAWTKYGESGTTYAAPAPGAMAEITVSASAPVTLTLDANSDVTTESLKITGGAVKIVKGAGTGVLANFGATTIQAPVTAAYDAVQLLGPLSVSGSGSIVFDFTAYPLSSTHKPTTVQMTGLAKGLDGKVTATLPANLGEYTMDLGLTSANTYVMAIGITREAADLNAPEGDLTITDTTTFALGEDEVMRFYEDDWIVVSDEKTITISEDLTQPAKIKVVEGGILKLNFASEVTKANFKYDATVRVEQGGVYDIANAVGHKDYSHPIVLAGGTLTNSGIATGAGARQYWQTTVEADSTIAVPENEFGAVADGAASFSFNLSGYRLTKTGTGTFTFRTATFAGGGTLQVDEGAVVLDNCSVPSGASLNYVIAEDARIEVVNNSLAKSGTVTGEGMLVYKSGFTTSDVYQNEGWSGTVWLKNIEWDNANLGRLGNATTDAAYKFTGVTARPDNDGCNAPMILEDEGAIKALTISTNVTGAASYHFNTVKGSGTFQWNPALTEGDIPGRIFWLKNVADYTGKLVTGNYLQFTIGGTSAGELTPGTIKVADGATICPGNWSANSIAFGRTLTVKSTDRKAVLATVSTEPTLDTKVTLVDPATGVETKCKLKAKAVTGGYQIGLGSANFVFLIK